jgi:MFS family permease
MASSTQTRRSRGQSLTAQQGGRARLTRTVALATLLLVAASYVVNAMDRQVFPVILPSVRAEFGFSLTGGGLLSTIFTLGLGLAGIPTGYLLDRLSRKTVMLIGIFVYSAFTLLTALAVGYGDMFVYRALSGVGEALQNAALFSAVGAYFFANRALALGSLNFAYGLGGFLGPNLGARMAQAAGWRMPFYVYSAIGLAFVVLIMLLVSKRFTEQVEGQATVGDRRSFDHVWPTLYNRNVILLAVTAVVVGISMYGYIGLYPSFLQESLHFSQSQAGNAASMFGLGALVGIPAGYLGDKLNQKWVLIVSLIAGCVVGFLIFNGPTGVGPQFALSFAEGAIGSGFCFVNVYSAIQRSVLPGMIGKASGIFVTSLYVPASVAGYLFAELVDQMGWGGAGLVQLGLLPLIGVVAMLFVDRRRFSNATVLPGH